MTVRIERSIDIPASRERVWAFIADPEERANAISVVVDYTIEDEAGTQATWYVELPIPLVKQTVTIETQETERREPEYVSFVGRSAVVDVTGEHEITPTDGGCRLVNRFVVDGRLPGVERYFEHRLDDELENLGRALLRSLEDDE